MYLLTSAESANPCSANISFLSVSMKGIKCATAFFITLADLITWGKNILPAPNRSPTTLIPAIKGPSITFKGRGYEVLSCLANSVSSTTNLSIP